MLFCRQVQLSAEEAAEESAVWQKIFLRRSSETVPSWLIEPENREHIDHDDTLAELLLLFGVVFVVICVRRHWNDTSERDKCSLRE